MPGFRVPLLLVGVAAAAGAQGGDSKRRRRLGPRPAIDRVAEAPAGTYTSPEAGNLANCAPDAGGMATCRGYGAYGLADSPGSAFTALSAGQSSACGLRPGGTLECWGVDPWTGPFNEPAGESTEVFVGSRHSCGVRTDRTVLLPGSGSLARAGEDGRIEPPDGMFAAIGSGYDYFCGLRTGGTLACPGTNRGGQSDPPAGMFTMVAIATTMPAASVPTAPSPAGATRPVGHQPARGDVSEPSASASGTPAGSGPAGP